MRIINPNTERTVHVSEIAKSQLAREVNAQTHRIRQLDGQIKVLAGVLIAIVRDPEAFAVNAEGVVTIALEAVKRVKLGDQLTMHEKTDVVELRVVAAEDAPVVETPRILVPAGSVQ